MGFFDIFKTSSSKKENRDATLQAMDNFPDIGYQFQYIKSYKHSKNSDTCYLIEGTNLFKAKADLQKVNRIIQEHAKSDKNFAKFSIDVEHARFSSENMKMGYDDFCCLYCTPLTPSGKLSKFWFKMRICPLSADEDSRRMMSKRGKTIHGWIYYLKDGSIGKIELYCWQGENGYFIKDNYTLKSKN